MSEPMIVTYYVSRGEHVLDPNAPKPLRPTLHERFSDRINWWLSDCIEWVGMTMWNLGKWLRDGEYQWTLQRWMNKLRDC